MKYQKIIIGTVLSLLAISVAVIYIPGNGLKGVFYQDKYNWKYDKPYMIEKDIKTRAVSMMKQAVKDAKTADCAKSGEELAGGDKESTNMMVGQEYWDKKYGTYQADGFLPLIPKYIAQKIGKITDETNCFFAATDFHIAQCKNHIMTNTELAQILSDHYCPIKKNSLIKYGDLVTVQAPQEKNLKNYHHAAIIMNKNFILDKPNGGLSSVRIAPIATVYDEWAKYFKCIAPWPQNKGYQCIAVRYWRFQG